MSSIVRGLEGSVISTLEPIVLARPHCYLECLAGHILQPTTAGAVESRPPQRLAIAAAVTHAQPAVLPELALRTEATGCVNVSTEATGTDGTNTRHRAQQFDFRESLGRAQHQQPRLLLRRHALIQDGVKLVDGRAQIG